MSFGFWRKTVATFHLIIIIYSMLILIGIYIYQVGKFWKDLMEYD
jgi:ABC-type proline/glycine betaine transport system permease subunit